MILNRLGNKRKLASKIISLFPKHSLYVEPFFGAGGMFFAKKKAKHNIVNDLDSDVFNLFQVVMSNKIELLEAFKIMPLHSDLLAFWNKNKEVEPIKKALRFLLMSNFTFLGKGGTLKLSASTAKAKFDVLLDSTHAFLANVQFSNKDFEVFLKAIGFRHTKDYKTTFAYADPPYLSKWSEKPIGSSLWDKSDSVFLSFSVIKIIIALTKPCFLVKNTVYCSMLKAYKYRIFPNETQKGQLQRFFGVSRLVYNFGLETKTTAYASNKKSISKYDLIKQLPELKKEFDFIKECPSQVLQHSLINLDTAYQNFFKGKGQFPKFKNKYSKQSITFPQGYKVLFDEGVIRLPKLKDISIDYHRKFEGKTKRVTLSKTVTNKYFVSILVDTELELPKKKPIKLSTSVGVDFGIKDLAITSDGVFYANKRFFKSQQKRLRVEQRSLARKQKDSKNREKQRIKVALLQEKIRNQRTDYLHKISTELIRKYDTIALEDLAVRNMVKNRCLSKAISDMGWRQLRTMLEYKAAWYGKNIVIIGRFAPSSKICSNCGNRKSDLKLSDRIYNCDKCGFSEDRDLNAAQNIKNFGVRNNPAIVKVVH